MKPDPSGADPSPYSRSLPNLGFDPCPGDVGLTTWLARRHSQIAAELRSLSSQLGGIDFTQWQGQAADATKSTLLDDVAPALRDAAGATDDLATGLQNWAVKLSGFQGEADALERRAALQAAALDGIDKRLTSKSVMENKAQDWSDATNAQNKIDALQADATDLYQRYLDGARYAKEDVSGEHEPWIEGFNKVAGSALTPFQAVAGDYWVHLTSALAELPAKADEEIENIEGLPAGTKVKSKAILDLAKDFENDAGSTEILPSGVRTFALDNPDLIRGASMLSAALGLAGDAGTLISPEDKGAMGTVDRSVAGTNGVLLLGSETGALDAIAATDASVSWVPGVGEVVIAGSGVYLGGDWLYNHWAPAHDLMNNDATAVVEMPDTLWNQVKDGILSFSHIPGGF